MAKAPTYRMKSRMIIVLVGMVVFGFCIVLHQLFTLQIVKGEEYQAMALRQQLQSVQIGAKRGSIYDRNGKALAQSATVWTVCVAPAQVKSDEKRDAIVDGLSKILDVDKDVIRKKLEKETSLYERIKTKVEKPQADEVTRFAAANGIGGAVFLEEDTRRYYPYGNFAATVLGFTNSENKGGAGLESFYDKTLAGTPGRVVSMRNSRNVAMPMQQQYEQAYPAQDGDSLVLTIDENVQHFLEKNLEIAVAEHKVGNRVAGIVMNVKTGEILGMATKPDFDPNDPYTIFDPKEVEALAEYQQSLVGMDEKQVKEAYQKAVSQAQFDQWRNKAISDPYEPGSVFKIITTAGALESGAVTANSSFYCPGYVDKVGRRIHCWVWGSRHQGHGQQDLALAIKNSCNPAFVAIGEMMGITRFQEYFENFGLTQETDIDLPGEAEGIYHAKMTLSDLYSSSYGQTFKVTPIQLITAVNAAVNGGNLMQPYIVKQIVDSDGNVVSTTEPTVKRQVISEDISKQVALLLEKVVSEGSGKQSRIPGYRIGGKTGTSEKLDLGEDHVGGRNILSFYGFGPVEDPQIGCLVLLDEPDLYNAYGSTVAAPVVGSILADVFPYMGIEPEYTEEELEKVATTTPYLIDRDIHDAESVVRIAGLKYRIVGEGTKVVRQIPGYQEPISKDGTIVIYTDEEQPTDQKVTVPNVVGMTVTEANHKIINAGLNIAFTGADIEGAHVTVSAQSPAEGEQVDPGTVITVSLVESQPPAQP